MQHAVTLKYVYVPMLLHGVELGVIQEGIVILFKEEFLKNAVLKENSSGEP